MTRGRGTSLPFRAAQQLTTMLERTQKGTPSHEAPRTPHATTFSKTLCSSLKDKKTPGIHLANCTGLICLYLHGLLWGDCFSKRTHETWTNGKSSARSDTPELRSWHETGLSPGVFLNLRGSQASYFISLLMKETTISSNSYYLFATPVSDGQGKTLSPASSTPALETSIF